MEKILVIDFGSQYTQLIARRLRELSVYSEVCPWDEIPPLNEVEAQRILSASPYPDFDGNTVDLDREMAKIAENQLMYNATLRMLAHKFRGLKSAIAEGRS